MKLNLKKEIRTKSIAQIRQDILEAKKEQREMELEQEMGKLKNTSSLRNKKSDIAVMNTILNELVTAEKIKQLVEAKIDKPTTKKGGKNE